MTAEIGFVIHATGQYYRERCYELIASLRQHCAISHRVYAFADAHPGHDETIWVPTDHADWPMPTLLRYNRIAAQADIFEEPYLFQLDADMQVVAPLTSAILGERVATLHPGYVGLAGPTGEQPYYCGAFNGGERAAFLAMARAIAEAVNAASAIPVWHDETLLNAYYREHPPTLSLPPAYCYPGPGHDMAHYRGIWKGDYEPVIQAIWKRPRQ